MSSLADLVLLYFESTSLSTRLLVRRSRFSPAPAGSVFEPDGFGFSESPSRRPQTERFADFLYLRVCSPFIHTTTAASNANTDHSRKRRLLVVRVRALSEDEDSVRRAHAHHIEARAVRTCLQEVPNVFLENPAAFHSLISEFVRAFKSSSRTATRAPAPAVFIFTLDAGMTTESGGSPRVVSTNSFRRAASHLSPLERLFPRALRDQLQIPLVSFALICVACLCS